MSFTHTEHWTSRNGQEGDNPSRTLVWALTTDDPENDDPFAYLASEAPTVFGVLPRRNIGVDRIGPVHYMAKILYGYDNRGGGSSATPPEVGDEEISFSIDTESKHITTGKSHVADLPASPADPYQGAIGVTADDVQGTDVLVPIGRLTVTGWFAAEDVDLAFIKNLVYLVGKTNADVWKGFAIGEVLFIGCQGGPRGGPNGEDYEISFNFAISQNLTAVQIGDIGTIDILGWDHVWTRMKTDVDTNIFVQVPESAHVERIYSSAMFSTIPVRNT